MGRLLGLLLVGACAARTPASSGPQAAAIDWPTKLDHASTPRTHRAAAIELFESINLREVMGSVVHVSVEQQVKLQPSLAPYADVLESFMAKYLSYDALRDELAELYVARFDELQLRQLIAFYRTPTGRVAATKLQELFKRGSELGLRRVQEHREELQQMIRQRMEQDHPSPVSAL